MSRTNSAALWRSDPLSFEGFDVVFGARAEDMPIGGGFARDEWTSAEPRDGHCEA